MSDGKPDDDKLNLEIRKFLKKVGITSQREIERAIYAAVESGQVDADGKVRARVTMELPDLGKTVVLEADLELS
jgi:16S rRNA U516 pseudouridylate synthase RsuA-like enzyme